MIFISDVGEEECPRTSPVLQMVRNGEEEAQRPHGLKKELLQLKNMIDNSDKLILGV